jgi:putative ABC transport system ATP-binding protein
MAAAGVRVERLTFAYDGDFELRIDDLRLDPGERVACIGPSGSGKTTLLHLLAGILLPDAGRVEVAGTEWSVLGPGPRRRRRLESVGLVFQEFELIEHLSVADNVLLPFLLPGGPAGGEEAPARLTDLAKAVGIEKYLGRRPRDLSQGERQRAALCRALITQPGLLLADEPTGNLDPETTARVVELMLSEAARHGATLLVVTHDHALLDSFDRVVDLGAER